MKHLKRIWGLAIAAMVVVACQSGNTYKIDGVAEGLEEGDAILMINPENNVATDTLIVHDGKFTFEGNAENVAYTVLRAPRTGAYAMFFTEPGTIHILLSASGASEVSGTKANDGLQEYNKIVYAIEQRSNELMMQLSKLDEEQQATLYEQYQQLQEDYENQLLELAKRHIDNEFGYTLITQQLAFSDMLTYDELNALVEQMPKDYRQREAITSILESIKNVFSTNEGDVIANFTMQTVDGKDVNIRDEVAKNRITVLDFWASWCQPCRNEMPFMKEMLGRWQAKGLGIVGISLDEDQDAWKYAVEELQLPWLQISDSEAWESKVAMSFKINAIPFTVVVDQKGTILAKRLRGEELEQFISEQLAD